MLLWILSLTFGLSVGGAYGALNWHAHEMVFGFSSAILAGFSSDRPSRTGLAVCPFQERRLPCFSVYGWPGDWFFWFLI
jgi:hypothetical protein